MTDEHWKRAVDSRAPAGAPVTDIPTPVTNHHEAKKPLKNKGFDGSSVSVIEAKIPPARIEQTAKPLGNQLSSILGTPLGTPSQPITPELSELIELWNTMDSAAQADLLTVARGWAVQQSQHARNHPHNPHKTAADGN